MSAPTLFGCSAAPFGGHGAYRWSWEGFLFSSRLAEWPGGWGWAGFLVDAGLEGHPGTFASAELAAADLERFLAERYPNAHAFVRPRVGIPEGLHQIGDFDWGRALPVLSEAEIAEAALTVQGRITDLRRDELTQHLTASLEDACRIARALPASAIDRVLFSPDRSFAVGPVRK